MAEPGYGDEDLELFADLERAARECKLTPCLIGAGAIQLGQDLAWGVRLSRRTRDWDFAVHVASWAEYEVLGNRLTAPGRGFHRAAEPHRFRHRAGGLLDVIPYGGLERPPGTLQWPDGARMDTAGLEVLDRHHESHRLGAIALRVASLPAVVGLKLLAYRSRRPAVTRDVGDVHVILRDTPTSDERVANEAFERLAAGRLGYGELGAYLLGRDVGRIFAPEVIATMLDLLSEATAEESRLIADVLRSAPHGRHEAVIDRFEALRLGIQDR